MSEIVSVPMGERELSFEMGRVAKQANGAALMRYGDTVVLVTACTDKSPKEGLNFLPLTCDYREYAYAAGKVPGGFFKREGRPTEKEILTCRLIDRPIRPLFPDNYRCETQIIAMVLSAESEVNPDILALNGASAAAFVSDIPFDNPFGAVRVGLVEGRFVLNPTFPQLEESSLNMVVVATEDAIVMVEAAAPGGGGGEGVGSTPARSRSHSPNHRQDQGIGFSSEHPEEAGRAGPFRCRRWSVWLRSAAPKKSARPSTFSPNRPAKRP